MTSEIRRENDIELKFPKDSQYIMREEEEKLKQARDEKVSMPLHVPKNITKALPFKSKAKVKLVHDFEGEDRRRRTNLLQKLNLPSKRPFKSQFLNNSDKKIYSLVQRLGTIGKQKYKENQKKLEVIDEKKKKEDAKREDAIKKARNRKREEKMKRKRKRKRQ